MWAEWEVSSETKTNKTNLHIILENPNGFRMKYKGAEEIANSFVDVCILKLFDQHDVS